MSIKIEVKGARVSFSKWDFKAVAAAWRKRVAPTVLAAIKAEAPVYKFDDATLSRGQKPGDLRASIKLDTVKGSSGGIEMIFISDVPYAKYVVEGTRRHRIPLNGDANPLLHWERQGVHWYRRFVDHPGTDANDFPRRGVERVKPVVGRTLETTVSEYIQPEQL